MPLALCSRPDTCLREKREYTDCCAWLYALASCTWLYACRSGKEKNWEYCTRRDATGVMRMMLCTRLSAQALCSKFYAPRIRAPFPIHALNRAPTPSTVSGQRAVMCMSRTQNVARRIYGFMPHALDQSTASLPALLLLRSCGSLPLLEHPGRRTGMVADLAYYQEEDLC